MNTRVGSFVVVAALFVALACAGGCGRASGDLAAADAREASTTRSGPAAATVPALGPVSAKALAYSVPRSLEYSGKDGKTLVVRRGVLPDCLCAGRTWTIKLYEIDATVEAARAAVDSGAAKATQERTFVVLAGGAIGMTEQIDRAEGVEVVFEPAMVVMPDGLPLFAQGSAEMAQDLKMVVHPLGNRSKIKSSGMARNLIRYMSDEQVVTPAGTFTARRIVSTLSADLSPAMVSNITQQWFVDGVGMVQERDQETTKVLGVRIRNNLSEWVLEAQRAE